LREKYQDTKADDAALASQTQVMLNLNMQLQNSAMKSLAKSIELELRRMDVSQALRHVDIIQVRIVFSLC
jgi:dynactin 1